MKIQQLVASIVILGLAVGMANAEVKGHSSNAAKIQVGAVGDAVIINGKKVHSTGHKVGQKGNAGIAVINANGSKVNNKFVDIAGLRKTAENTATRIVMNVGGQDSVGVVQLDMNKWSKAIPFAPDHSTLGKFSYKELPNNVYFGEWHQASSTSATDKDRTVYYVGKTNGLSLPTSGTATYNVVGINQYNGQVNGVWNGWTGNSATASVNNLLTGILKADFKAKTLAGDLKRAANGGANVTNTLNIKGGFDAKGQVTGNAVANGNVNGKVNGQFFGTNAASVAGVAVFGSANSKFDTAFGGSKK